MKRRLEIVPFEVKHLEGYKSLTGPDEVGTARLGKEPTEAYTALDEKGRTIFCMGRIEVTPWCQEVWFIATVHIIRWPREAVGIAKKYLKECCLSRSHRVQAVVLKDWEKGNQFMQKLGFRREGILKALDEEKRDYNLYARVR